MRFVHSIRIKQAGFASTMWRMSYTIVRNLYRLPRILETMHRMANRTDIYSEEERYKYVQYVVGLIQKTGFIKTESFGTENLPKEGGYVMFPNHQGKYDCYGIAAVHDAPMTAVMDREMSYFVLVNEIMEMLRGQRLDLSNARQALKVINTVAEEVAEGRRYVIFPEGAYDNQKKHTLWDFKAGCFKAAVKAKAPIVPIALVDSYKVFNTWRILPVKTQVHFLEPLYYEDYAGMRTVEIAAIVKERIQAKLTELGY